MAFEMSSTRGTRRHRAGLPGTRRGARSRRAPRLRARLARSVPSPSRTASARWP